MTKILTAADILGANDAKVQAVEVPEWGGTVHVRVMSGAQRDAFEAFLMKGKASDGGLPPNLRATFVSLTLCGPDGAPMAIGVDALGQRSGVALDRVFKAAQTLNALDPEAQERLGNG